MPNNLEELEKYKEKFESNIQKTAKCFYWSGRIDKSTGRGKFRAGKKHKNVTALAWEYANKQEVPEGFIVKQVCANIICVRPDHLELHRRGFPWRA